MLVCLVLNRFDELLLQPRVNTHSNSSLLCKIIILFLLLTYNNIFQFFSLFFVAFETCTSRLGSLLCVKR